MDDDSIRPAKLPDSVTGQSCFYRTTIFLSSCILLFSIGCARNQYMYGTKLNETFGEVPCKCTSENPVFIGGEYPKLDQAEKIIHAPKDFVRRVFNRNIESDIDPSRVRRIATDLSKLYFSENGLTDIFIDVDCYEPAEQWKRLKANDRISPFWKYTAGTLDVIKYTLVPSRVSNSDHFSPFTNTLSINSTKRANVLYESAQAKQYRKHDAWLGTYSVLQNVPLVPVFHKYQSASDVLTYATTDEDWELVRKLYPATYRDVGSSVVSSSLLFAPLPGNTSRIVVPAAKGASTMTGKLVGKMMISKHKNATDEDAD